jgi:hypothetical protein
MLRQQTQPNAASPNHVTAVRGILARNKSKHGRLARTVSANQTDMFTGINLERCTTQNILRAIRFVNI